MVFRHPDCFFLVAGHAEGTTPLNAFDNALVNAGVGDNNLVRLSSILPPHCTQIEPVALPPGALIPVAYSKIIGGEGVELSAVVAVAIPADPDQPGLVMEHCNTTPLEEVQALVGEMVREGMRYRNREIAAIHTIGSTHMVEQFGACFAGVVLWVQRPPGV